MQIIGLNIDGALSRLASQQEASQENVSNLLNRNKVLAFLVIGGACLFTLHSLITWKLKGDNFRSEKWH